MSSFLQALYGYLPDNYWLYLWTLPDKRTYSYNMADLNKIEAKALKMSSLGLEVYFGVGALSEQPKKGERGKAVDVKALPGLWVDIDLQSPAHKHDNLPPDIPTALHALPDILPSPTLQIDSGHGLHLYWLFREPWEMETPNEQQQAEITLKRLQNAIRTAYRTQGWGLDATADLARVLRFPGTLNHKLPDNQKLVTILSHDDRARYNPSDFDNLPDIPTPERIKRSEGFKRLPTDGAADLMLANCAFLRHCQFSGDVKYPELLAAVTNLVRASDGVNVAHELIKNTIATYDYDKTEVKIAEALEAMHPQGCDYIRSSLGFTGCPDDGCGVKAPCGWSLGKLPQARAKVAKIVIPTTEQVMAPDFLSALATLKKEDPGEYGKFKDKCRGVLNLNDLERGVKQERQRQANIHLATDKDKRLLSHFLDEPPIELIVPPNFNIGSSGIAYLKITESGDVQTYKASGNPVIITRRLFNIDSTNEKVEIAFWYLKGWRKIIMPRSTVLDARRIMQLSDYGVSVTSETGKYLVKWLDTLLDNNVDNIPVSKAIARLGWRGDDFTIPTKDTKYVLDVDDDGCKNIASGYTSAGSLADWLETMQILRRYPIARFMLAASFAAPLLKVLDRRNFIVHNSGITQSGKTATLWAALSVWGNPSILAGSYNATQTSMERMAAFSNDLPFGLNERELLNKFGKQDVGPTLYMLVEGRGKDRGTKTGLQATPTWRTVILSTGEGELTSSTSLGGLMTRVLELTEGPLVDNQEFAKSLYAILPYCHGVAGVEYIQHLTSTPHGDIVQIYQNIRQEIASAYSDRIDNHIDSVAVVAMGDYLANIWLFDQLQDKSLSEAIRCAGEILEMLPTQQEASESERAWLEFCDWLAQMSDRFNPSNSGELYGYKDDRVTYIIASKLNEWLNGNFSSARKIIKEWADLGYVDSFNDFGKIRYSTKGRSINGTQPRVVKINA